jgi:hypothetical protein
MSFSLLGCGYRPAYAGREPAEQLSVEPGPTRIPQADAIAAALGGARAELSRAGALRDGSGYPRMVVELVRVDEKSAGIAVSQGGMPLARGSTVAVTGRAWVEDARGAEPSRDTGDLRRVEQYASEADSRRDSLRYDQAVRAAADELGHSLGRLVLGLPEPAMEPF